MTNPTTDNEGLDSLGKILRKYFTGEQYDDIHGTFIRIPFNKQMEEAKAQILKHFTPNSAVERLVLEARIETLKDAKQAIQDNDIPDPYGRQAWYAVDNLEPHIYTAAQLTAGDRGMK